MVTSVENESVIFFRIESESKKRSAHLKRRSKVTRILIPSVHNFIQSMYNTFSTELRNILHRYCCLQHMDRKLALQNLDILDSIPATVQGRDYVVNDKCFT